MTIFWPEHNGKQFVNEITLSENYAPSTHDYLYSETAKSMFEIPATWIKENKNIGLLEIGCGSGWINSHLDDYDYSYYGVDTSAGVIDQARQIFTSNNIHFEHNDWNNHFKVPFEVDCILAMGVLSYGVPKYGFSKKNGSPEQIIEKLIERFNPKNIIIRETRQDQTHIAAGNKFEAADLTWVSKFKHESINVDIPMWLGNKVLINIEI